MNMLKPILKWAGGKSQLLPAIQERLPSYIVEGQDFCLVEPFFGGGALSFFMLSEYKNLKKMIINDMNQDLVNVYQVVRDNVQELMVKLDQFQAEYDVLTSKEEKEPYFLLKRKTFNQKNQDNITQAAIFIFLNKAAFNGLYRVNKKNEFNVPIGSYKKPIFYNKNILTNLSEKLAFTQILCGDYTEIQEHLPMDLPSFFYLDPPYRPISQTASFNQYGANGFNDEEQRRLSYFCRDLNQKGHQFLLSNSDPKNTDITDSFFDDLYYGFNIERVAANRAISASTVGRKLITELMIYNYAVSGV